MIELNLLEKKAPLRLPSVLGLDLNGLNFKMIGIALFVYYIPEIFVRSHYEEKLIAEKDVVVQLTKQNEAISKEIGKNTNIKSQLEAYNGQVEKLKARSTQVDEILKIRTNPKKVLEKIARSIPDDLWFDLLKITDTKEVIIQGGSYSPRNIGEFITAINDSPFFANSVAPTKQENKQDTHDGVSSSYELFELKGKIKNYDMRSK